VPTKLFAFRPEQKTGVTDRLTLAVTGHPTGLTAVVIDGAAVVAGAVRRRSRSWLGRRIRP
jgi:hypothetical protein